MNLVWLTKRPVWHRSRTANELCVLIHYHFGGRSSKEKEIKNATYHLVSNPVTSVDYVHCIAIEQQYPMSSPHRATDVHVERVGSI